MERSFAGGELSPPSPPIQRKLAIGRSDDPAEAEADRIADQVMRMAEPGRIGSAPSQVSSNCEACQKDDESAQNLQTKRDGGNPLSGSEAPPVVYDVLRSPGQPLDPATRAFMEPRFGREFGDVRTHTDAKAAESTRAVHALAYTVGQDIVFGSPQQAADTAAGHRLIAHELAHVVQQTGGASTSRPSGAELTGESSDAPERVPNTVALEVAGGKTVDVGNGLVAMSPAMAFERVQRQGDEAEQAAEPGATSADSGTVPAAFGDMDLSCHYRLGCPISVECEGKSVCGVASCGTGECRSNNCPPGFKNVIFKAWCQYDCKPSGAAFLFITHFGSFVVGPFCID